MVIRTNTVFMKFTDSGEILLQALEEHPIRGNALVVHADSSLIMQTLQEQGLAVSDWDWRWSDRLSLVWWPARDLVDTIVVHIPAIRELNNLVVETAASRLAVGGELIIYGGNHEGMKSIADHLAPWFENAEVLLFKQHQRVITARRAETHEQPATDLEDWQKRVSVTLGGENLELISYPGMFAHGSIDPGTRLFLDHLPACVAGDHVLDMGCGNGILARAIAQRTPDVAIDAVDLNAFALEATRHNVPTAKLFWGNSWKALPNEAKYQVIVSNPPVHRGLEQSTDMLEYFITEAKKHLLPGGLMALVVQGTTPVKKYLNQAGFIAKLIAEDDTYQIWQAR